jgi:decaprenylphospho-beta-D-erythro-pentofuranosid-2-ulose 2-reductase
MEGGAGKAIIGISSVAGDRGRGSNYVYGSAKAGLTALLSGLRNSLAGRGIRVMTVKPGFVDTRMTAGMALPKLLTAQPGEVARAVINAHLRGKDVIYVKPIWRVIMTVIRAIPEFIFKKMKI